jgi:hypothetical protein
MEIIHVQTKESRPSVKKRLSTTAGLTSSYQRTNITTSGVSVVETTGGYMVAELLGLPCYESLPFPELLPETQLDLLVLSRDALEEGYKSMASENSILAEESLPIVREVWPIWEG